MTHRDDEDILYECECFRVVRFLDEDAWSLAVVSEDTWIQTQPDQGMPASQPTVLRIIYDDENLYIGAHLYDSDPSGTS